MTRIEHIIAQLATHPLGRSGEIRVADGGLEVRLEVADWDRLGCLLEAVEVRSARGVPLVCDPTRVAETVSYLGETLQVIEAVNDEGRALLRSVPPSTGSGSVSFFEMALDRLSGVWSLRRYAADRQTGERRRVAAPLTRHVVERLVVDLMDLAAER